MIEVFKIVHNDLEAAVVNMDCNTFNTTRGNEYKLHTFTCHHSSCIKSVLPTAKSAGRVEELGQLTGYLST